MLLRVVLSITLLLSAGLAHASDSELPPAAVAPAPIAHGDAPGYAGKAVGGFLLLIGSASLIGLATRPDCGHSCGGNQAVGTALGTVAATHLVGGTIAVVAGVAKSRRAPEAVDVSDEEAVGDAVVEDDEGYGPGATGIGLGTLMIVAGLVPIGMIATVDCAGDECSGAGVASALLGGIGGALISVGATSVAVGAGRARRNRRAQEVLVTPTVAVGGGGSVVGFSVGF